jgi:hypothetical protein
VPKASDQVNGYMREGGCQKGKGDRPKTRELASASGQLDMANLSDHAALLGQSATRVKSDFTEALSDPCI